MTSFPSSDSATIMNLIRKFHNAALFSSLVLKRPHEVWDRLKIIFEARVEDFLVEPPGYELILWSQAVSRLEAIFKQDVWKLGLEEEHEKMVRQVKDRIAVLEGRAPFPLFHNADFTLAGACYVLCRLLRPEIVVETGVAYGVTSSLILKALEVNGKGVLHSIDLPPLGKDADQFVGILISETLRHRWHLHRGISRRVLPELLKDVGEVNIFVHDSLHTYRNMRFEFEAVSDYITHPGVLLADDVNGNRAFLEWVQKWKPDEWFVVREEQKQSAFGIGLFGDENLTCS